MLESLERIKQQSSGTSPAVTASGPPTDFFASFVPSPAPTAAQSSVRKVSLDKIDPWMDADGNEQPFHLYSDEKLQELADNIIRNGLITPVRLRISPFDTTRYQTLAGHNRIAAARLAGMTEIDALVENVDEDTARLILVDSNLYQREKLLPSEKAFAYKMQLDSLKRKAGRQKKENASQVETHLRSDELVAKNAEDSRAQIQRYISLTRLLPSFLDMVDDGRLPFMAGVNLSFLSVTAQERVYRVMQRESIDTLSLSQAEEFKAVREELTEPMSENLVLDILGCSKTEPQTSPQPKPPSFRFCVEKLSPQLAKKYKSDPDLQAYVADAIQRYIEEREAEE